MVVKTLFKSLSITVSLTSVIGTCENRNIWVNKKSYSNAFFTICTHSRNNCVDSSQILYIKFVGGLTRHSDIGSGNI